MIDEAIIPTPEPDGAGGIAYFEYVCDSSPTSAASLDMQDCRKVRTKPIRMFMNVVGYANAGDYRVPIGGVTYNVRPTIETDIDVEIEPRGDAVRVSGKTTPVAANQDMEVEVRYPSGRYVWLPVATDTDGEFGTSFVPEEEGTVSIAVNYPAGGDFAPVKVDGRLFVPGKTGVAPGERFCLSCTVQSAFWIITLILLVSILLIVLVTWRAVRR